MDVAIGFIAAIIVALAMCVEGITGFGAAILALPFLTLLLDITSAVTVLSTVSFLWALWIVYRHHASIARKTVRSVLLFSGLGLPLGFAIFAFLPESILKAILGVFITLSSLKNLLFQNSFTESKHGFTDRIILFLGGIVHGAYATGGPLITLIVKRAVPEKASFRVSMSLVWVCFNAVMLVKNCVIGSALNAALLKTLSLCLPSAIAGAIIGSRLHNRINAKGFERLTNILILAAGLTLLFSQVI